MRKMVLRGELRLRELVKPGEQQPQSEEEHEPFAGECHQAAAGCCGFDGDGRNGRGEHQDQDGENLEHGGMLSAQAAVGWAKRSEPTNLDKWLGAFRASAHPTSYEFRRAQGGGATPARGAARLSELACKELHPDDNEDRDADQQKTSHDRRAIPRSIRDRNPAPRVRCASQTIAASSPDRSRRRQACNASPSSWGGQAHP